MVIVQGEVWWADLGEPVGSTPALRRPVVIVQSDALNQSKISTVICVPLTSNLNWANAPGNVTLPPRQTGLSVDSVVNVSQILVLDKNQLQERINKLPTKILEAIFSGIDIVLGR